MVATEQFLESLGSPNIPIVRVSWSGHHPPLAGRRPIVTPCGPAALPVHLYHARMVRMGNAETRPRGR
jgi:hypothetical protein